MSQIVNQFVDGDAMQPPVERVDMGVLLEMRQDKDEDVMEEVLGFLDVFDVSHTGSLDQRSVGVIQQLLTVYAHFL